MDCRDHGITIPEEVLDTIYAHFKKEHDIWMNKFGEISIEVSQKRLPKERILSCALRTESLNNAYKLYKQEKGISISDCGLRKKLERALDDELTLIIRKYYQQDPAPEQDPNHCHRPVIPKLLKDKVFLYKELLADICRGDSDDEM